MYLDIRTLEVAAIVICSVLGPVSLALGPGQRYLQPSRYWGAGLVALAGGLALVSLRGHASTYVSQVIGMGLVALALTFAQTSALKISDEGARDVPGWILLGVIVLGLHVLGGITSNAWLHRIVGMGTMGFLCCRVAYGFDRSRGLREGRPLRALALMFGFFGLLMVLNAAFALAAIEPGPAGEPSAADELMLVSLIAGLLLGTILLLWVMTERIQVRMRRIVSLDPLTGAMVRRAFMKAFELEAGRALRRPESRFSLLLVNIDHFRRVNDAYGHRAGDRLLATVAEIARAAIRKYDLLGRIEGDVFAILLPGAFGEAAAAMAERLRREIEQQAPARAALKNPVSVSVGLAAFGEHGERWEDVLRAADAALRSARAVALKAMPPGPVPPSVVDKGMQALSGQAA
jgi:diguanylate cyclase (GGDEF)-like protein